MPNLKFRQLLILSDSAKSANQFRFKRLTLITANDNSVGKSTLVKLLLWGLGCEPTLDTTWKNLDVTTVVKFSVGDKKYEVKRSKSLISLKFNDTITEYLKITGEYSSVLADILGFKALLPNQSTGELEIPPPAYYFLPFYIDQKRSWSNAWDNFLKLGQYSNWKPTIIKYHVGLLTPEYFELEIEKIMKKNNKKILNQEIEKIENTIEVIQNYMALPESLTTTKKDDFEEMTREIEKDLSELTKKQEAVLDTFSNLQFAKSHLEHQKKMAAALVNELDKDYVFSIENIKDDNIECPLCGTSYENSVINRSSILKDKNQAAIQLDYINEEIHSTDLKLERTIKELDEIRTTLDNLNSKYLIEESDQKLTFSNIIESIGGISIRKSVTESKVEKQSEVVDLTRGVKLANKAQKALYSQEYIDDINESFNHLLGSYIKVLNAQAVNLSEINSPLSYNKIVNEGGAAENSRAILSYYLTIFSLVEKYGNEVVAPLIIDTPNQQEQSDYNYSSIVDLILNKISKNNQVIICAMSNPQIEPLKEKAFIIDLNESKLLDINKYQEIKNEFDLWDLL